MDEIAFAHALALTDDSYDPADICNCSRIRDPLLRPGEVQLSPDSHSLALLLAFTVNNKRREALLRAPDTHLSPAVSPRDRR